MVCNPACQGCMKAKVPRLCERDVVGDGSCLPCWSKKYKCEYATAPLLGKKRSQEERDADDDDEEQEEQEQEEQEEEEEEEVKEVKKSCKGKQKAADLGVHVKVEKAADLGAKGKKQRGKKLTHAPMGRIMVAPAHRVVEEEQGEGEDSEIEEPKAKRSRAGGPTDLGQFCFLPSFYLFTHPFF